MDLTDRQTSILKHLIEEYIDTAKPVGSEMLDRKFNLGVSPATLRNEMSELTRLGYLKQPHTSAGRVPTPKALRFYVDNLMPTKKLPITDEVKIKERVWDYRAEFEKTLQEATRELAETSKALAVSAESRGATYYAGAVNILDMPEFFDIDLTRNVLSLLDHFETINRIFQRAGQEENVSVLMGDDLGYDYLAPCGVIFTRFGKRGKRQGTIGIIGPYRLNYPKLIPTVQYFGNLMDEMEDNW